jgi:hypothetical protein
LAVMHHYRTCEFGGDTCLANPSVQDRSAWKYGDALAASVRRRFRQFGVDCPVLLPTTTAAGQHSATIATTSIATNVNTTTTTWSHPFLSWRTFWITRRASIPIHPQMIIMSIQSSLFE